MINESSTSGDIGLLCFEVKSIIGIIMEDVKGKMENVDLMTSSILPATFSIEIVNLAT